MKDMEDFLEGITTAIDAGDIDVVSAAQRTVRYVQSQLGCDLVSYWVLQGETGARSARRIACADVDDPAAHLEQMVLEQDQCADYLELIATGGLFVSSDAQHDPHLAAMRDDYLIPGRIQSTMCVTIAVNGESTSVISCSQRSSMRVWTAAEITKMQRLAAQISLRRARRRSAERTVAAMSEAMDLSAAPTRAER